MKKLSLKMVALIAAMMMCLTAEAKTEFVELITRHVIRDLGENIATDIHNYAVFGLQNYSIIFKSKNQRPF